MKRLALLASLVFIALLLALPALAADFTVNSFDDAVDANPGDGICEANAGVGDCTLRAAVGEANTLASADAITLPTGHFPLKTATLGDLVLLDMGTLTITGAGASKTVVDGLSGDRIFDVDSGSTVTLQDMTITGGFSDTGAIWVVGNLTLERCSVVGNTATGGGGGGILAALGTTLLVEDSTFANNAVSNSVGVGYGGAIVSGGSTTIRRSTFMNNYSSDGGGAISTSFLGGSITVENSTFSGNIANAGGTIFAPNTASTISLAHCTVVDTTSTNALVNLNTNPATFTVSNSIISASGSACGNGTITSGDGNLVSDASCGFGGGNDAVGSAMLAALGNNGGPTMTHLPMAGSPAIDMAVASALAVDQRGVARPQGAAADKGAVEVEAVVDPGGGGSPIGAATTLYLPRVSFESGYTTGIAVSNILNASSTDVTVTYYQMDGTLIGSQTETVPQFGQISFLANPGVAFTGNAWAQVTATNPVYGLGLVFEDNGPMYDVDMQAATQTSLRIPHQDSTTGSWSSTVLICNPGSSDVTAAFSYRNESGGAISPPVTNITVPAKGAVAQSIDALYGSTRGGSVMVEIIGGEVAAFLLFDASTVRSPGDVGDGWRAGLTIAPTQ